MNNRSILYGACCTLFLSFSAHGADLWEVLELAQRSDPVYQSARFNFKAQIEQVPQARSQLLPFIDGGASAGERRRDLSLAGESVSRAEGTDSWGNVAWDVSLVQPLFDKRSWGQLKQARLVAAQAAVNFQGAWEDLALRTAVAYFSVLAARDNLDVVLSAKRAFSRQLELATERLEVGLGTQTDVFDAEARYQLSEAEEVDARNLIEDSVWALAELIGARLEDLSPLAPYSTVEAPDPPDVESWVSTAMERNTALRGQRLGVEIADQQIELQRADRLPVVDLNLSQSYLDSDGSIFGPNARDESTDLLLRLRVPFYAGGLISSRTKEAAAAHSAILGDLETVRRAIERTVRVQYLDVASSITRIGALERSVTANQSTVKANEEGFAAGLNTNREVLDAQVNLFQARRDLLVARYGYIQNVLELERVSGLLDLDDVRRVNSWLQ